MAQKFAWDLEFQFKLHLIATAVWAINGIGATCMFLLARGFWNHFSVYYLVIVSLYANFATDYDACSASLAGIHAKDAAERIEDEQAR